MAAPVTPAQVANGRPRCHVVVVTFNSADHLPVLLADLAREAAGVDLQVCVVDNGSTDGTRDLVRDRHGVTLLEPDANLGYAGGINVWLDRIPADEPVLVLNPDLAVHPGTVAALLSAGQADRAGVVVPAMVDGGGVPYPSLRREPSLVRALFDAAFGGAMRYLPGPLSEMVWEPGEYTRSHDVDWATGAAMLLTPAARARVPFWDAERFFLYSEETDYCRRVRDAGLRVTFVPEAVVGHVGGGSGSSTALVALMQVNRIRYFAKYHSRPATALFHGLVAVHALIRSYAGPQRRVLGTVARRSRWSALPGGVA